VKRIRPGFGRLRALVTRNETKHVKNLGASGAWCATNSEICLFGFVRCALSLKRAARNQVRSRFASHGTVNTWSTPPKFGLSLALAREAWCRSRGPLLIIDQGAPSADCLARLSIEGSRPVGNTAE
jgi:hypothetical protein